MVVNATAQQPILTQSFGPGEPAFGDRADSRPELPPGTTQPGVAAQAGDRPTPNRPGMLQPGVTTPPAPHLPDLRLPDTSPNLLAPNKFRPIPNAEAPAIDWQHLHAPTPVLPVAPIMPPPRVLRIGAYTSPVPDSVPENLLGPINGNAAALEAGIATGLNSLGINASRSDKIAGLTIAGAATGAVAGAALAGLPAAAFGAVPGAVIGTGIGAVAGGAIGAIATGIPTAGAGSLEGAVVGALAGAGIGAATGAGAGAALVGIPAAIAGGLAVGLIGGAAGAAFGGAV
ncbi:hypothetical protein AB0N05_18170 [Nocardia sp. NPDC051030]|uniref:hypothetical protein n=1 Tax=Nocardia sp. NPDC051030 TaxID=3155162 RepID=UPI00343254A9